MSTLSYTFILSWGDIGKIITNYDRAQINACMLISFDFFKITNKGILRQLKTESTKRFSSGITKHNTGEKKHRKKKKKCFSFWNYSFSTERKRKNILSTLHNNKKNKRKRTIEIYEKVCSNQSISANKIYIS